ALEMLRQDRIFDRAEKGRLNAGQEHGQELQPYLVGEQAERGERNDADLDELDAARQHGLVELVRDLPGGRREDEKRQDQEASGNGVEEGGIEAEPGPQVVDQQDRQGIAEGIVVEGADRLRDEKRPEAPSAKQRELIGMMALIHRRAV